MLHSRPDKNQLDSVYKIPVFNNDPLDSTLPKYRLSNNSIDPELAYRLIKDDLLDEGSARLNLATFCQTYMEPAGMRIMSETLEKNAIDKSEYPQTTDLENRCVNIIANLWNAPEDMEFMGTSTVGSSEACMLGGLAMKFSWREKAKNWELISSPGNRTLLFPQAIRSVGKNSVFIGILKCVVFPWMRII